MVHDLWQNQRRPQGGGAWVEWWGRIQCAEIRLMYYDIAVRNSCNKTPHLQSISLENVGQGREFNQEQREKEKEKEPLCEDLSVMHKEHLCCEAWFQCNERERCGGGLWFWLECKQAFKGALFRWMFTFSLWNLLFPAWKLLAERRCAWMARQLELWLLVTCLSQVQKSDTKSSFSRSLNSMCLHQLVFKYFSFAGPPQIHWGILD